MFLCDHAKARQMELVPLSITVKTSLAHGLRWIRALQEVPIPY